MSEISGGRPFTTGTHISEILIGGKTGCKNLGNIASVVLVVDSFYSRHPSFDIDIDNDIVRRNSVLITLWKRNTLCCVVTINLKAGVVSVKQHRVDYASAFKPLTNYTILGSF